MRILPLWLALVLGYSNGFVPQHRFQKTLKPFSESAERRTFQFGTTHDDLCRSSVTTRLRASVDAATHQWRLRHRPSSRRALDYKIEIGFSQNSPTLLRRSYPSRSKLFMSSASKDQGSDGDASTIFGLRFNRSALNFIATAAALVYSRPVPRPDIAFSIVFPTYLVLANQFRFNLNVPGKDKEVKPLNREDRGPWFGIYLSLFGLIGILLPIIACVLAPPAIAEAATPHLYLTCCQVAMETLTGSPEFHPLPRLLVPIGFNTYRLGTLAVWLSKAWATFTHARTMKAGLSSMLWAGVGLTLATTNMVAWIYNLFVFLLLRVMPQYLDSKEFPSAEIEWKGQIIPVPVRDE